MRTGGMLFGKHRTEGFVETIGKSSGKNQGRAPASKIVSRFSTGSGYRFSTGRPPDGSDESTGSIGTSKPSPILVLLPSRHTDLARQYETLRTLVASDTSFAPSIDDIELGLKYLELYDRGGGWESALGSRLERRRSEFENMMKAMKGKDSEDRLAIMKEMSREVFLYIDCVIPKNHLQCLYSPKQVEDGSTTTLPVLYQPEVLEPLSGKYKGSQIYVSRLTGMHLQRLEEFIDGLSGSSRRFRFPRASEIRTPEIAASIIANELRNTAAYFPLVDEKRQIVGLADLVKVDLKTLQYRYGKEGTPKVENVTTCEFNFVVADRLQGLGLGKKLYEYAMQEAKKAGYVKLYAKVRTDNSTAARFCESVGMEKWQTSDTFVHYFRPVA